MDAAISRGSTAESRFNVGGDLRSIIMNINDQARFNQVYQVNLNKLALQGKSPKT